MSPLLITCCVLFLAAFCVLAFVIENWRALRQSWESPTGPRRWGWIQSWGKKPKSNKILFEDVFDKEWAPKTAHAIEQFRDLNTQLKSYLKEYNEKQARELYNDGWRCGGGVDQSGRLILFRGESHAYVNADVWEEVERLTKAKWDELHGKPIPKYPKGTDSSPERPVVVGEKGKETIRRVAISYGDQGNGDVIMPGAFDDSIKNWNERNPRTQVTEVNEVPDGIYKYITGLKWSKVRLKGSSFLPSVNPLGDTGAFKVTKSYFEVEGNNMIHSHSYTFRHKKGGRRGSNS